MRQIELNELRAPALVVDLELDGTDASGPELLSVSGYTSMWCLVRRDGRPVSAAYWDVSADSELCLETLREAVRSRTIDAPPPPTPTIAVASARSLTVAICTRDRNEGLATALASLRAQSDGDFATLVIDNAPSGDEARRVVEASDLQRCIYVQERQSGLSRARNCGLAAVETELVAWMDDDEVADPKWIASMKLGFEHPSKPVAVCGMMLPAELETEAQVRFEQYGGFNKGRGYKSEVLAVGSTVRSALYPLPSWGSGGNMAFETESLRAVGGFDQYLGAGTPTHGGEETRALALLLQTGRAVLHWPSSIQWHYHRREMGQLRSQLFGYSAGLSAFYASMLSTDPRGLTEIVKLVPGAVSDLSPFGANVRSGQLPEDFPKYLLRAGHRGFLSGGYQYARASWAGRARGRAVRAG
jgi:hypothetical protein